MAISRTSVVNSRFLRLFNLDPSYKWKYYLPLKPKNRHKRMNQFCFLGSGLSLITREAISACILVC